MFWTWGPDDGRDREQQRAPELLAERFDRMANVLIVASSTVILYVQTMAVVNSRRRVGARIRARGRSVPIRRLAIFMWHTGGRRHSFRMIVMPRLLRLVSMRSMLTRHASDSSRSHAHQ
jgi:hypothetical protein